jgi:methyl-accepting chemotaxis protein
MQPHQAPRTIVDDRSASAGDSHEIQKMLQFIQVDQKTAEAGQDIFSLFEPHVEEIVKRFYDRVQAFGISPPSMRRRFPHQRDHWMHLFVTNFSTQYAQSVRQIGIRHRDIQLNPIWFVAGYTKIKMEILQLIVASGYSPDRKGALILALEKYVAIDMGLALSAYDSVLVD